MTDDIFLILAQELQIFNLEYYMLHVLKVIHCLLMITIMKIESYNILKNRKKQKKQNLLNKYMNFLSIVIMQKLQIIDIQIKDVLDVMEDIK